MKPFLKWPGGKENELSIIRESLPAFSGSYVEPFLGGGAVFFDISSPHCFLNDKSSELVNLYSCIKSRSPLFTRRLEEEGLDFFHLGNLMEGHKGEALSLYEGRISIKEFLGIVAAYFSSLSVAPQEFLSEAEKALRGKLDRVHKLEEVHGEISDKDKAAAVETALKAAYYVCIRKLLNLRIGSPETQAAAYYFVREYCYSSMFRYNSSGEFNVPYGGKSYNRKDFQKKVEYVLSSEMQEKISSASIFNLDFEEFMEGLDLAREDFVFLDPPYDSEFSTYAQNAFDKEDHVRLRDFLKGTDAKILLIVKNTDFIYGLYKGGFNIKSFDKKYAVSFMNRNERTVEHLIISNY